MTSNKFQIFQFNIKNFLMNFVLENLKTNILTFKIKFIYLLNKTAMNQILK